ncbi:hypothetical protein BJ944DRAFT_274279 [Cunninghamella echinulata]|nr:hypothetical protein BJ944DRAFT_274279 [Cunninghamella echinulata]
MELSQTQTNKKKKKLDASISAAAATLASFTQSSSGEENKQQRLPTKRKYNKSSSNNNNNNSNSSHHHHHGTQFIEEGCNDNEDCASHHQGHYMCDQCGISYQHAICLKRHTWDHTEGWSNRPLGISKRQQVQVLEAAQILMDIAKGMRVSVVN